MIANALACFIFSFSSNVWVLYLMRFMLGFTQAFCVIYGPVWVNEFSPKESNTKWMAILHSFVVIGVMTGYIMGAITITLFEKYIGWRFAFMIQGWFMIVIGFGFLSTDNIHLDIFGLIKGTNVGASAGMILQTISNDGELNKKPEMRPKSFSDAGGI